MTFPDTAYPFSLTRQGSSRGIMIWSGGVVMAIPFLLNIIFIINHFYWHGGYLLDSGWFASLMWQNGPYLSNPQVLDNNSFYATHFAPLLALVSMLSWVVPTGMILYFAIFQGIGPALLAGAVYYALMTWHRVPSRWFPVIAALVSLALAFNGTMIKAIGYPHYELIIPGLIAWFLILLFRGRLMAATVFFVLALMAREDAGFHMVAILGLTLVLMAIMKGDRRTLVLILIFLSVAFLYSLGAIFIQKAWFPGDDAFRRIYLGNPPLAHLTAETIANRLHFYAVARADLYLPLCVTIAWAFLSRNPYLVLGWLAYLPWFAVNMLARANPASELFAYYAYPFIISVLWPVIAVALHRKARADRCDGFDGDIRRRWWPLAGMAVVAAASITGLLLEPRIELRALAAQFIPQVTAATIGRTDRMIASVLTHQDRLGTLQVDASVAAMVPGQVRSDQLIPGRSPAPDSVLFFRSGFQSHEAIALGKMLPYAYQVPKTDLVLLTNRPYEDLQPLANQIQARGLPFLMLQSDQLVKRKASGFQVNGAHNGRPAVYGPFIPLPPGRYRAVYTFDRVDAPAGDAPVMRLDVLESDGMKLLAARVVTKTDLGRVNGQWHVPIDFELDQPGKALEIRIWWEPGTAYLVTNLKIERLAP